MRSVLFIRSLCVCVPRSLVEMLHLVQASLGLDQPYALNLNDFRLDPTIGRLVTMIEEVLDGKCYCCTTSTTFERDAEGTRLH